jgi:hypothetical protein
MRPWVVGNNTFLPCPVSVGIAALTQALFTHLLLTAHPAHYLRRYHPSLLLMS